MTLKEREKADTHTLTVRMPREVYEVLRTYAFATDQKMNEAVVTAVSRYLAAEGRREEVGAFLQKARQEYRVALDKLADR
ncbi:MAG: DNA-binding protein [Actinomycetota bacterium]